jgi:hypothetical protein
MAGISKDRVGMTEQSRSGVTLESDLVAWSEGGGDDVRELIVEAKVPPRRVRLAEGNSQRQLPEAVVTSSEGDRELVLNRLHEDLSRLLDQPVTLLKSAGALVVQANREQLRAIIEHPLVKAVRPNRRLR